MGFAGVVVLVAPWGGLGDAELSGQLACLAATACYGVAFTYMRRFVTPLGLSAVAVACVQVSLGALPMLLGVLLLGEQVAWSEPLGAALVVLGIAITQGRLSRPGAARVARADH